MPFEIIERTIDPDFLARARAHVSRTGQPLLEGPADAAHVLLVTGDGPYSLTDASAPEALAEDGKTGRMARWRRDGKTQVSVK